MLALVIMFINTVTQILKSKLTIMKKINNELRASFVVAVASLFLLTGCNKDLEQFTYIISHNLRAPVANIIGLSFRLQQTGLPEDLRNQIGAGLSTSVTKLDEVIRDLNDILKIRQKVDESKQL